MIKKGIILLLIAVTGVACAQQLTPDLLSASSGSITNGTTNIYWSIGETVVATMQSSRNSLSSGYEQPQYYLVSGISHNISDDAIKLYPNPMTDILSVRVNDLKLKHAHFILYNTIGSIVKEGYIDEDITSINCNTLSQSTYFLKISDTSKQLLQTYKIVKL